MSALAVTPRRVRISLRWPGNTRFHKAFLAGWDSALIHPRGPINNPYHRADYRRQFLRGRERCLANERLPRWAQWPFAY